MRNSIAHGRQVAIRTSLLQFGATVIAALIAVAAVGAMGYLGNKINKTFNNVSGNLKG